MLGYEPMELTGKNVFELIHPEDASTIMEVFTNSLQNPDAPPSRELRFFRFLHKNGSWRDLEAVGNRFLEDSQVVGFVVNSRDISERKRVEEALQVHTDDVARSNKELAAEISQRMQAEANLRESEERFRRLSDAAFEAVVIHEMGEVIEVNQAFTKMLGYEPSEIIGKSILDLIDPAYRDEVFERICSQDETPIEAMGLKKDGTSIFVEANAKTIPYEGRVARVTALRDITERKRAEEQISASLKEKEVLLKEIHHRVKNNLQVISSLLYLQSDYIKDQATKDMFKESQNRVRSMALIHEKLYQTDDLANVDFSDYTKKLTADLLRSYGLNPMAVTIQISIEDVFLGVDTAIPCGLIINELVSNALKYAFPEGRDGVIRVDLRAGDENTFTLIVGDNGVGFPKGMDFQNTDTLGLELVNMLTKQIGGTVELHNTNGTEFEIEFHDRVGE